MKFHDSLIGTGLIAFAVAIFWDARGFPSMPGDQVGPALFPQLIAAGLAICGAIFIVPAARRGAGTPWIDLPEWFRAPRQVAGFAIVTLGLLAYSLLVETLGFFVCAPLLLGALLVVLGVRAWTVPVIAIGVSVLIHFIFYKGLGVPLPWGLLQSWAW
ncbi:MAG: tripartite tricarboxylate transporter TctB family protein [Betaproteobacteria bacterium]